MMLIKVMAKYKLTAATFATQTFTFKKMQKSYDAFAWAATDK